MEQVKAYPRLWSGREVVWSNGRVVNSRSVGWIDLAILHRESDVNLLTLMLRIPLSRELPVFSNREVHVRLAPSKQKTPPPAAVII